MKIPPLYIALDAIGCVLAGVGMAEYFAQVNVVPASLQFENFDIAMIVVGVILVIPMLMFIVTSSVKPPKEL